MRAANDNHDCCEAAVGIEDANRDTMSEANDSEDFEEDIKEEKVGIKKGHIRNSNMCFGDYNMEKYKECAEEISVEIKALESKYSTFGTLRFIMFIVAAVGLIVGLYDSNLLFLVCGLVGTAAFIALVFFHGKLNENLEYMRAKQIVYQRYVDRFDDKWKNFEEDGSQFLQDTDLVSKDLDLLGNSSLYQFICVAGTEDGKAGLADTLKDPKYSMDDIMSRQKAIKELVQKEEFSLNFETLGVKSSTGKKKKYTADEFLAYCESDAYIPGIFHVLRFLLPAITLILLVLGIAGKVNLGYALISFFVILMFSWITSGVAGQAVMPMVSFGYVIEDYIRMFEMISEESFHAELLKEIQACISKDAGALNAIRKLQTISAAFNIRYNPIVHQLLCGLTMWDFHLGVKMDNWKREYGNQVKAWIQAVSQMEELLSFAVLARTRKTCYPSVSRSRRVRVLGKAMRHPLIHPDHVVANDADFSGGATIITGSNMSGKTTFLRTLGVNLILAFSGAPVCADSMSADYMKIFTSMRVTDDVSNGISTFYAEILRIKTMVEYKKNGMPMLCLIDEIFKGTNSADRIVGATQVIKKLSDDNAMTIVSTHDFELCDIKNHNGKPADNYHFEEYYVGEQLKFDYKKKNGRCTTTNAMAILHMAGLD